MLPVACELLGLLSMATPPRFILEGQTLFVTGCAVNRQFRFVPDRETSAVIRYSLAECAEHYGIRLHAFKWMSNHYHLVLTDVRGVLPSFMRDLNSRISRALNALRETHGENFERAGYNMVVATDRDAILRHCAYAEANACIAHLVDRATDWTGVSSAGMRFGRRKRVRAPESGVCSGRRAQGEGGRADCVELVLEPPPGFEELSLRELRREIDLRVADLEKAARAEREAAGHGVVGMRAVCARNYWESPDTPKERSRGEPRVSGSDSSARRAMLDRIAAFEQAYRAALKLHKVTKNALFPLGTWWMRVHLGVRCESSPP